MDLSLDEIIKKKKIGVKTVKKGFITKKLAGGKVVGGGVKRQNAIGKSLTTKFPKGRIIDARNKIIQKNRAKIRDAREKLAEITKASGDARLRLLKKRKETRTVGGNATQKSLNNFSTRKMHQVKPKLKQKITPKLHQLVKAPPGYVDYDHMEDDEDYQPPVNLRRTVHNDMLPPFSGSSSYNSVPERPNSMWSNDPFDCYEIPVARPPPAMGDSVSIRRQIRNMSPDILPPKGILRQSSPPYSRRFIPDEASHLSYEMRTRLERAPDPHASMGIFANPLKQRGDISSGSSSPGYRIVVSNLHSSVTQSDIKELFEDIGELQEARLVRPGVAEVIFSALKDAEKAVDTYHNRQLDGQPMKCLLVNPRSSNKPTAPAIKSSSSYSSRSSGKTPLEIDIDALHKVLFRRH